MVEKNPSARVLAVVGASGGVGASVLATAVAVRARRADVTAVLVDGCPYGGGLDVTLGADHEAGVRWGDLGRLVGPADGRALLARLPAVDGLPVLSFGREEARPTAEAVTAVLTALAAECGLVVADLDAAWSGGASVAAAVMARADRVLVVAGDGIRQLAALALVPGLLHRALGVPEARVAVCLRGGRSSGAVAGVVESELRLPVLCVLGHDRVVAADLLHGVAPGVRSRGPVVRAADEVLAWSLLSGEGVAA